MGAGYLYGRRRRGRRHSSPATDIPRRNLYPPIAGPRRTGHCHDRRIGTKPWALGFSFRRGLDEFLRRRAIPIVRARQGVANRLAGGSAVAWQGGWVPVIRVGSRYRLRHSRRNRLRAWTRSPLMSPIVAMVMMVAAGPVIRQPVHVEVAGSVITVIIRPIHIIGAVRIVVVCRWGIGTRTVGRVTRVPRCSGYSRRRWGNGDFGAQVIEQLFRHLAYLDRPVGTGPNSPIDLGFDQGSTAIAKFAAEVDHDTVVGG